MSTLYFDVETPNGHNDRICQIGVIYENGKGSIVFEKSYLVNPETYFDKRNVQIHGITQSMCEEELTFDKVWNEIGSYFDSSLVVGHNLNFDLSVLIKTLTNYDLSFASIQFVDTYIKAQTVFSLDNYKLDTVSGVCGYDMLHHHDALDDTRACRQIYKKIDELGKWTSDDYHIKYFKCASSHADDSEMKTEMNVLEGLLVGIGSDGVINNMEVQALEKWVEEHKNRSNSAEYMAMISAVQGVIADRVLTEDEYTFILKQANYFDSIKKGNCCDKTLAMQKLKGIIEGIEADHEIDKRETVSLRTWMLANSELSGIYPFDRIYESVTAILSDGIVTAEESKKLSSEFQKFINPVDTLADDSADSSELSGKTVCLTGEFDVGTRSAVEKMVIIMGGVIVPSVTKKTQVLLVGTEGSKAWSYGNYGAKVKKAMQMQENGSDIEIMKEKDIFG